MVFLNKVTEDVAQMVVDASLTGETIRLPAGSGHVQREEIPHANGQWKIL